MRIMTVLFSALVLAGCGNGCDLGKIKDKAMEYKDKIPTDKIPTKLPK